MAGNRVLEETYPDQEPTGAPANDYERIQTSPDMFGGLIAGATEKLGGSLEKASNDAAQVQGFYNQVTADDTYNKLDDAYHKLQFGDPNDPSNPGYFSLKGQAALGARAGVEQEMEKKRQELRAGLNPVAQLQFDQNSRRLQSFTLNGIGRHADQQFDVYSQGTATATIANAIRKAGTFADDDQAYSLALQDGVKGIEADLKAKGIPNDPSDPQRVEALNSFATKAVAARVEGLMTTDPAKATAFLKKEKASIDPQVYDQLTQRLAKPTGEAAARDTPPAGHPSPGANLGPTFTRYNQFLNTGDVQGALRLSEGLRTNAYWDVNHWRTGYGSDTVTRADGSIEPVTATTQITPADAERDLQRRTAIASQQAQSQVGPAWTSMSPSAHSALTSVVYNYGHLPHDIATAAASGDQGSLASAIAAHAHDNDGVNAQRRLAEAHAVMGTFGLSGPQGATGLAPTMTMPGAPEPQQPQISSPTIPLQNAVATGDQGQPSPDATVNQASVGSMAGPTASPEDYLARKIQAIEARGDLSDAQKAYGVQFLRNQFTTAQIAAEQDSKAKKAAKDATFNEYDGMLLKGDYTGASAKLANDPRLDNAEKLTLQDVIARRSGEGGAHNFGPKYHDILNRVLAQPGDPTRISDVADLYRSEAAGDLTEAGVGKLRQALGDIKQSVNGYGVQATKAGAVNNAKRYLSFEEDTGFGTKIRDPKGEEIFDTKFLPMFESAFDDWTMKQGKDPHEFPLFDPKKMDAFLQQLRPKTQRDRDRLGAMGESPQATEAPNAPLPPPPRGVGAQGWQRVVKTPPPSASGTPFTHSAWATALEKLTSDPDNMSAAFDASKFGKAGYRAADILRELNVRRRNAAREPNEVPAQPVVSPEETVLETMPSAAMGP